MPADTGFWRCISEATTKKAIDDCNSWRNIGVNFVYSIAFIAVTAVAYFTFFKKPNRNTLEQPASRLVEVVSDGTAEINQNSFPSDLVEQKAMSTTSFKKHANRDELRLLLQLPAKIHDVNKVAKTKEVSPVMHKSPSTPEFNPDVRIPSPSKLAPSLSAGADELNIRNKPRVRNTRRAPKANTTPDLYLNR